MTDITLQAPAGLQKSRSPRPDLDKGFNPVIMILFFGILGAGLLFVAYSLYVDVDATGAKVWGLQLATLRNIAMAWVLTLPAAMALSGGLYFLFSKLF